MATPQERDFTPQERRLKILLRVLAFVFGLAVLGYLLPALAGPNKGAFIELPFVTNSVVKVAVLALMAFFASGDVRRYRLLAMLVIIGHIISELAVGAVLLWGKTDGALHLINPLTSEPISAPIKTILWGSMILDGIIIILLVWFYLAAERARYGLRYLSPTEFRALAALAEVVITSKTKLLKPEEVAYNVDTYLAKFNAQSKFVSKFVRGVITP
jgi:hypothetical protein